MHTQLALQLDQARRDDRHECGFAQSPLKPETGATHKTAPAAGLQLEIHRSAHQVCQFNADLEERCRPRFENTTGDARGQPFTRLLAGIGERRDLMAENVARSIAQAPRFGDATPYQADR